MVIQERKQFPIPQQVVCCRPLKNCVTIAGRDFQYVLNWIVVEASELWLFVIGLNSSSYFDLEEIRVFRGELIKEKEIERDG